MTTATATATVVVAAAATTVAIVTTVARPPGLSVRLKLTLSYAGFLMLAGVLLIAGVWVIFVGVLPDVTASPEGVLTSGRSS